ncbi:SRPBCC family protein [Bacillus amyloliquefaciens]|nr:SRPBCC family protein [Bacillus amyloliquefaciens]
MADYQFSTVWRVEASVQEVWEILCHPDLWPEWWESLEQIIELKKGDVRGIGALHRYTWKGALPYRLTFDIHVLTIQPLCLLEGEASGEVEGRGVWSLSERGRETIVRYDWDIRTNARWMNVLAPLAGPVFRWNHDRVMRDGAKGLARRLGRRVEVSVG